MKTFLVLFVLLWSTSSNGQDKHPEHEVIIKTIDKFFLAINTSDAELTRQLVLPDAMNYTVGENQDGQWQLRSIPQTYYLDQSNYGPEKITERYWSPTLLIDNHIAVFWAPYDFYIDGEFSHCGIDAFDLVKVDDTWKIGNASWTRQKIGCTLHPDGPPAVAEQ